MTLKGRRPNALWYANRALLG